VESHPELKELINSKEERDPANMDADENDLRRRLYNRMSALIDYDSDDPRCNKFSHLSEFHLRECAMRDHGHDRLDVIPEAFLWHVFDQLVNAALVMHRGAVPLVGEGPWKEIVHKDLHLGNILLKPKAAEQTSDGSEPRHDRPLKSEKNSIKFVKTEVSGFTRS
jgi:hypothetical protein